MRRDFISKPLFLDIVRVPNFPWEVCCTFIDVGKLDKFGIEVWIAERAIGHERVVEMLWLFWISLQGVELSELRFDSRFAGFCGCWRYSPVGYTGNWWWSEEVANLR